jgi:hypothetical protein
MTKLRLHRTCACGFFEQMNGRSASSALVAAFGALFGIPAFFVGVLYLLALGNIGLWILGVLAFLLIFFIARVIYIHR